MQYSIKTKLVVLLIVLVGVSVGAACAAGGDPSEAPKSETEATLTKEQCDEVISDVEAGYVVEASIPSECETLAAESKGKNKTKKGTQIIQADVEPTNASDFD